MLQTIITARVVDTIVKEGTSCEDIVGSIVGSCD